MFNDFFEKKVEYFWEYEYPFAEIFLKDIFGDDYKRKYSLTGDGVFNLVFLNDKIYDISFKETKSMVLNDGKSALRDTTKNAMVKQITDALDKENIEYTVNSGKYITFKIKNKYIAKLEIVKKMKMPT